MAFASAVAAADICLWSRRGRVLCKDETVDLKPNSDDGTLQETIRIKPAGFGHKR